LGGCALELPDPAAEDEDPEVCPEAVCDPAAALLDPAVLDPAVLDPAVVVPDPPAAELLVELGGALDDWLFEPPPPLLLQALTTRAAAHMPASNDVRVRARRRNGLIREVDDFGVSDNGPS
jgi:hypothetical protein